MEVFDGLLVHFGQVEIKLYQRGDPSSHIVGCGELVSEENFCLSAVEVAAEPSFDFRRQR